MQSARFSASSSLLVTGLAACALAGLGLTGCGKTLDTREEVTEQQKVPMADKWSEAAKAEAVKDGWIDDFQDDTLVALVNEAMKNNTELASVVARVSEAEAQAKLAGAQLKPTVDLAMGASASEGASSFGAGLQATWELDVWGRLSKASEAALLDLLAVQSDLQGARQALAARVADAWFLAISARQQLDLAEQIRGTYATTRNAVQKRQDVGTAKPGELELAKSDLSSSESVVAEKEGALKSAQRSLEILLGRYPAAELKVVPALPPMPPAPPAGLPSDLLERRPDVVAADRRVSSAFNRTGSARAARLPRLAITADVGTSSSNLGDALNPANAIWNVAGNLLAPIFDGGRLQAQEEIASAQQKQAIAGYRDVALNAFKEVEESLSGEQTIRTRLKFVMASVKELDKALDIADAQFKAGDIDILQLNQVQRRTFSAREQVVALRAEQLRQRAKLYLALGGDFEKRPENLAPSPEEEAKLRQEQDAKK